jgi:hypothetical protein
MNRLTIIENVSIEILLTPARLVSLGFNYNPSSRLYVFVSTDGTEYHYSLISNHFTCPRFQTHYRSLCIEKYNMEMSSPPKLLLFLLLLYELGEDFEEILYSFFCEE